MPVARADPAPPRHLSAGSPSGPQGAGRIPLPSVALPKCLYLPTHPPPLSPTAAFLFLFLPATVFYPHHDTCKGEWAGCELASNQTPSHGHTCPWVPCVAGRGGRVESRCPPWLQPNASPPHLPLLPTAAFLFLFLPVTQFNPHHDTCMGEWAGCELASNQPPSHGHTCPWVPCVAGRGGRVESRLPSVALPKCLRQVLPACRLYARIPVPLNQKKHPTYGQASI